MKIMRVFYLPVVFVLFVVGLLTAMDAFVPRSSNVTFAFHACEFFIGLLTCAFAWRALAAMFKRRDKKVSDDVWQNQFGCCFAIVIFGCVLMSIAVVILYAVYDLCRE